MQPQETTVIDFLESPKTAALYFDYVVPMAIYQDLPPEIEVLRKILPKPLLDNREGKDVAADYLNVLEGNVLVMVPRLFGFDPYDTGFINNPGYQLAIEEYWRQAREFLVARDLVDSPMLLPGVDTPAMGEKREDILLTLAHIPQVDVTHTSWDQILEFRRDKNSVKKLRKLRLFFRENYSGKDHEFIADDLAVRLDDYENTTKDWGFETFRSTLSMLLSSKTLASSGSAALVSILFGVPNVAAAVGIAGALAELGKISLHIAKHRYGLNTLRRDHALSYIIDAKESLETKTKP